MHRGEKVCTFSPRLTADEPCFVLFRLKSCVATEPSQLGEPHPAVYQAATPCCVEGVRMSRVSIGRDRPRHSQFIPCISPAVARELNIESVKLIVAPRSRTPRALPDCSSRCHVRPCSISFNPTIRSPSVPKMKVSPCIYRTYNGLSTLRCHCVVLSHVPISSCDNCIAIGSAISLIRH